MSHSRVPRLWYVRLFHFPIQTVQNFLAQVSCDRLAKALFQLAICGGSLAVPQDLVLKEKTPKANEQTKKEDKPCTSLPSEGIDAGHTVFLTLISVYLTASNDDSCLSAEVKKFLKDHLSSQNSAITLMHIASLEKKLTKHFQVKDFLSLSQGNFLEFLVKHIQVGGLWWTVWLRTWALNIRYYRHSEDEMNTYFHLLVCSSYRTHWVLLWFWAAAAWNTQEVVSDPLDKTCLSSSNSVAMTPLLGQMMWVYNSTSPFWSTQTKVFSIKILPLSLLSLSCPTLSQRWGHTTGSVTAATWAVALCSHWPGWSSSRETLLEEERARSTTCLPCLPNTACWGKEYIIIWIPWPSDQQLTLGIC